MLAVNLTLQNSAAAVVQTKQILDQVSQKDTKKSWKTRAAKKVAKRGQQQRQQKHQIKLPPSKVSLFAAL